MLFKSEINTLVFYSSKIVEYFIRKNLKNVFLLVSFINHLKKRMAYVADLGCFWLLILNNSLNTFGLLSIGL